MENKRLKALAKRRVKYNSNKAKLFAYFGGKCAKCGGTNSLEIHSVAKGEEAIRYGDYKDGSWDRIRSIIDKFILECRSHRMRPRIHGTMSMYNNHKCRCAPCTAAWASYIYARKVKARTA